MVFASDGFLLLKSRGYESLIDRLHGLDHTQLRHPLASEDRFGWASAKAWRGSPNAALAIKKKVTP